MSQDLRSGLVRLESSVAAAEKRRESAEADLSVMQGRQETAHFAASVFSPKGVRSYALDKGLHDANESLLEICQTLFGGEFSIQLSPTVVKKSGGESNSLGIEFSSPGGSYESASSGERRKADLALQIALSVLSYRMGRGATNLFIGDEILDSLDRTAAGFAVTALEALSSLGKEVVVVSHDLGVQSYFSSVLWVEKKDGVSAIREG
jgi:DNA repair exonuclease SbcCD ATPase subunit